MRGHDEGLPAHGIRIKLSIIGHLQDQHLHRTEAFLPLFSCRPFQQFHMKMGHPLLDLATRPKGRCERTTFSGEPLKRFARAEVNIFRT